jgi:hypothetical protein
MPHFAFFVIFLGESCQTCNLSHLSNIFVWPPTSLLALFSARVFDRCGIYENPHTIRELTTAIQSETEAISAETLTKALNNFILCLQKDRDLRGHHMEHVSI